MGHNRSREAGWVTFNIPQSEIHLLFFNFLLISAILKCRFSFIAGRARFSQGPFYKYLEKQYGLGNRDIGDKSNETLSAVVKISSAEDSNFPECVLSWRLMIYFPE